MTDKKQLSTKNITQALAASKSKKSQIAAEESIENDQNETNESTESTSDSGAPKRHRLSDEERVVRDAEREKARAEKRSARDEVRAAKKAAKDAEKANKVPHMAKVEKQARQLPALAKGAQSLVTDILQRFDDAAITSIIAHLGHTLRVRATERALRVELREGQLVRIVSADGGNGKWVGHLAHVTSAQRIRCYVQPVGTDKSVYLFSSNVQPLSDDEIKAVSSATQRPMSKAAG